MPKETCWLRDWQNLCEPRIWRRHPKIALSLYRRLLDVRIDQTVLYFSTRHYLAHMENILKGLLGNKPLLPYRYHQRMINTVNEHVRSLKSEAYWVPPEPPTTGDQFFNALILMLKQHLVCSLFSYHFEWVIKYHNRIVVISKTLLFSIPILVASIATLQPCWLGSGWVWNGLQKHVGLTLFLVKHNTLCDNFQTALWTIAKNFWYYTRE